MKTPNLKRENMRQRPNSIFSVRCLCLVLGCIALSSNWAIADQEKELGKNAIQWELIDYRGKPYRAEELEGKVHVIAFLGTECPLAKLYSVRLEALQKEYERSGVLVISIDANEQDSLLEISAFARKQELTFPILKDPDANVAKQYGATRTPEMFVIDASGKIRYSGRMDDQYVIGNIRQAPDKQELRDALEAVLADKEVVTARTQAVGCLIGRRPEAQATNDIVYTKHVAPIMQAYCVDCHHAGDIGPMALDSYDDVSSWSDMILEVTGEKRMPPWHADAAIGHFANDRSMPQDKLETLRQWVAGGCQPGDVADMPAPKTYTEGWQLPREPDLVLNITEEPYTVPAIGEVKYQYFAIDPKFTEDKWVQAAEIQPGNRSVVHHILVFAKQPDQMNDLGGDRSYLTGYVPGTRFKPYPDGTAKKIPAGSRLVFQVHYTPVGVEQKDASRIGFIFAKDEDITREIQTTSVVQPRLAIPPHDGSYQTEAILPEKLPDCELIAMSPHMHLRGKSFFYEMVSPEGERTPMLNVPKYDFNWQTAYALAEPQKVKAGSRMFCKAAYDNSDDNPYNPDSNQLVRWGDQTDDEMMIGYFDIAVSRSTPKDDPEANVSPQNRKLFGRWDANADGKLSQDELPVQYRGLFSLADTDRDGSLNLVELDQGAKLVEQSRAGK
jgi:peroxiredoxin